MVFSKGLLKGAKDFLTLLSKENMDMLDVDSDAGDVEDVVFPGLPAHPFVAFAPTRLTSFHAGTRGR